VTDIDLKQVLPEAVVVTRNGGEKLLPLGQSKEFNVYYRDDGGSGRRAFAHHKEQTVAQT
jgi:hypothetical protein